MAGAFGKDLVLTSVLVVAAFVGCGGSSKTNDESGEQGGDGGSAGTNASGRSGNGAAGAVGATSGTGASGASSGGTPSSGGTGEPRGGTGAVGPIDPPGPSFCGGEPCDPPLVCCIATGTCFNPSEDLLQCIPPPPDGGDRLACSANSQCGEGQFCMQDGLLCRGTGHCQPIDNCGSCGGGDPATGDNPCRVCGCDGNTYPDPQTACRAGVNAIVTGAGCGETNMEGGAGSSSIGSREYTVCGHDGQCPSGSFCCALAGRCYLEADRDICIPPPPGTRIACKTTENCGDREYCQAEGCRISGGCVPFGSESDCGVTIEPVCGCDGTTYTSPECAASRGVRIEHDGECAAAE